MGREQEELLGEACARGEEGVQLPGVLEVVEAAEGAEDALPGATAIPEILDELEVAAGPRGFDAEEHGDLGKVRHHDRTTQNQISNGKTEMIRRKSAETWHQVFRPFGGTGL